MRHEKMKESEARGSSVVNRGPGRPKKLVILEGEELINVHTQIPKNYWARVSNDSQGAHITWADLLKIGIDVKFPLDQDEKRIREIEEAIIYHDIELAKAKTTLDEIKRRKKLDEEIRKSLHIADKYPAYAFRHFIRTVRKANPHKYKITTSDETILKRWGISFDREKLNNEIEDFLIDFEEGILSDEEIIKRYSIKKEFVGSELEAEITKEIEKEVGLA
jgi:hypothetical protein